MKVGYKIKASELHGIKKNSAGILEMQKSFRFPRIIPREHNQSLKYADWNSHKPCIKLPL